METKLQFFIAGVQFRPKEEIATAMEHIEVGNELLLEAEPTNKYDSSAVQIIYNLDTTYIFLGYVPKKYSTLVTDMIKNKSAKCTVTQVNPLAKTHMMCEVLVEGTL